MTLSENLNRLKKENNLTSQRLSERTGIPKSTIDKLCSGISTNPSLKILKLLADGLNCSLDDFDAEIQTQKQRTLSDEEDQMINTFRTLDNTNRKTVLAVIDLAANKI